MIRPGNYNVEAYQGATFELAFAWSNDDVRVDLTGYTARMQIREAYSSPQPILTLTSNSEITLGGDTGTVTVVIAASVMEGVPAKQYIYDLELVNGTTVTRIIQGTFIVKAEVTR